MRKQKAGLALLAILLSLSLPALAKLPESPGQAEAEAGFSVSASDDSSLGQLPPSAPARQADLYYKNYEPGTLNVKIPAAFLPPAYEVELAAPLNYPVAAGGIIPKDLPDPVVPPSRMELINPGDPDYKVPTATDGTLGPAAKAPVPQYRMVAPPTKKVRKLIQPPSPYEVPSPGYFVWLHSKAGNYNLAVPKAFGGNPLEGLPLDGPMLVRSGSNDHLMAATVDDPADTRYYRNQDSFPALTVSADILTEQRPLVENKVATVVYQRVSVGGVACLALTASCKSGTKVYRSFYVFPEEEKYALLPRCIYSIENLRLSY